MIIHIFCCLQSVRFYQFTAFQYVRFCQRLQLKSHWCHLEIPWTRSQQQKQKKMQLSVQSQRQECIWHFGQLSNCMCCFSLYKSFINPWLDWCQAPPPAQPDEELAQLTLAAIRAESLSMWNVATMSAERIGHHASAEESREMEAELESGICQPLSCGSVAVADAFSTPLAPAMGSEPWIGSALKVVQASKLVGCIASLPARDESPSKKQLTYASDCSGLDSPAVALKSVFKTLVPHAKDHATTMLCFCFDLYRFTARTWAWGPTSQSIMNSVQKPPDKMASTRSACCIGTIPLLPSSMLSKIRLVLETGFRLRRGSYKLYSYTDTRIEYLMVSMSLSIIEVQSKVTSVAYFFWQLAMTITPAIPSLGRHAAEGFSAGVSFCPMSRKLSERFGHASGKREWLWPWLGHAARADDVLCGCLYRWIRMSRPNPLPWFYIESLKGLLWCDGWLT